MSAGKRSELTGSTDQATGTDPRCGEAHDDPKAESMMRGVSPSFVSNIT